MVKARDKQIKPGSDGYVLKSVSSVASWAAESGGSGLPSVPPTGDYTLESMDGSVLWVTTTSGGGPNGTAFAGSLTNNVHYEALSMANGNLLVWFDGNVMTAPITTYLENPPNGTTALLKARFSYMNVHGGGASMAFVSILDHTSGFFSVGNGHNSILNGEIYNNGYYMWIDFAWFDDGSGYKWRVTACYANP